MISTTTDTSRRARIPCSAGTRNCSSSRSYDAVWTKTGDKSARSKGKIHPSRLSVRLNRFILLATALCCLTLLWSCNGNETNNSNETPVLSGPPNTTYPMPPLKGASLANMGWGVANGSHSLFSDYKGKVLVLDFYATWCAPCRDSVPHLIALQKKYGDQGLSVVGLNVGGPGDEQRVSSFATELGIHYTLAKPDDDLVNFLLSDSDRIPQTFVFDRQGQLAERMIGFSPTAAERIERAIKSALQTPTP